MILSRIDIISSAYCDLQLYNARLDIVSRDPNLQRHSDLMVLLGSQAVSSDESDSEAETKSFRRISPTWRSMDLQGFLWSLDTVIRENRRPKVGHRSVRGAQPRQRNYSALKNIDAVAPPGLPENCYDEDWASQLNNLQTRELDMRGEAYLFPTVGGSKPKPSAPRQGRPSNIDSSPSGQGSWMATPGPSNRKETMFPLSKLVGKGKAKDETSASKEDNLDAEDFTEELNQISDEEE